MFWVVRSNTIRSKQNSHIPLIRINGSSTNASMGVHASQGDPFWRYIAEYLPQIGLEESAVAFLDYDNVLIMAGQIWVNLCPWCAVNHDRYLTVPHEQGSISEVRTEQLLDPDNRAAGRSETVNQLICVEYQCSASIVLQSVKEVVLHVDDNQTVSRHPQTLT